MSHLVTAPPFPPWPGSATAGRRRATPIFRPCLSQCECSWLLVIIIGGPVAEFMHLPKYERHGPNGGEASGV